MNYQRVHDQIIGMAQARVKPGEYCERHHIVLKSMGGGNGSENLVWLTGREHYLIHWLLFKIHRNQQTAFAWFRMTYGRRDVGRYTSHTFVYARQARAQAISALFRGRKITNEHRAKMRAAKLGKTYKELGRAEASPLRGRKASMSTREKIGAASRGKKHSDETRAKVSKAKMGALNPQYGKSPSEQTRRLIAASVSASAKRRELEKETA